jgi:hypothetical protein
MRCARAPGPLALLALLLALLLGLLLLRAPGLLLLGLLLLRAPGLLLLLRRPAPCCALPGQARALTAAAAAVTPRPAQDAVCPRGDACPFAHNVFELWLHPSRYRTQLCRDGLGCKRRVCFFAHSLDDLRSPQSSPMVLPDAAPAQGAGVDYASQELLGRMLGQASGLSLEQQVQMLLLQQQEQLAAQQQQADVNATLLQAQALLQQQQQQGGGGGQHALASISEAPPASNYGWGAAAPQQFPGTGLAAFPPRSSAPPASASGYSAAAAAFGGFSRADFAQQGRPSGGSSAYGDYPRNSGAFSGFGSGLGGGSYSEAQSYGGFSRANFMASRQSLDMPRPVRPMAQALPPRRSLDFPLHRSSLDLPMPASMGPYPLSSSQSSTYSIASSMASFNLGSTTSYSSNNTMAMRQGSQGLEAARYGSGSSAMHMQQRPSQLSLATLEEESGLMPASGGGAGAGSSGSAVDVLASQLYTMSSLFVPSKPPGQAGPGPGALPSPQPRDDGGAGPLASPGVRVAGLQEVPLEALGAGDLLLAQQQQLLRGSLLGAGLPATSAPAPAQEAGGGLPEIPESVMQMLAAVNLYNQQARQGDSR